MQPSRLYREYARRAALVADRLTDPDLKAQMRLLADEWGQLADFAWAREARSPGWAAPGRKWLD
ncbi:MAG TPA: hypothetical protein VGS12_04805 [Caulobacteraceae bacterium]|nr:hypothetical protein [Caulobacteraceae bacterium]